MALPYHWYMLVSLIVLSASIGLLLFYVDIIYSILSVAGVAVITLWLSWQVSKILKAIYDLCACRVDPQGKVVLVTGCSSGFGYQLTVRLDALGFHIIGCCRNIGASNVQKLKSECSDRLQVVRMDVSSDEEVEQIRQQFDKMLAGRKLWAIVNNAGIANLHGVEWGNGVRLFKECLDINTLGVIRVTRSFLPFLRLTAGSRLIIVTSVEDRFETLTQPSYAASKYATRAFANCCRRELRDMGVHVSIIAPAFYATELTRRDNLMNMLQKNWNDSTGEVRTAYGDQYYKLFEEYTDGTFSFMHNDITPVVDAMSDAVSKSCQPKYYARVAGLVESVPFWIVDLLPEELFDVIATNSIVMTQFKILTFLKNLFQ